MLGCFFFFSISPVCLLNVFDCNRSLTAHAGENVLLDCNRLKVSKCDRNPRQDITTIVLLMMWYKLDISETSQHRKNA